jgi:hypothetical protein
MFPKLKGMKELVPFYGGCEMILHLLYTLQYRSERCSLCRTFHLLIESNAHSQIATTI